MRVRARIRVYATQAFTLRHHGSKRRSKFRQTLAALKRIFLSVAQSPYRLYAAFRYSRINPLQHPPVTSLALAAVLLLSFVVPTIQVQAATSSTLNFQGRLLNASGSIVSDTATARIRFKLYNGGNANGVAGTGANNSGTGGTHLWSEEQLNIRIVNGYFSVNLGNQTAFPSTIDWSQELWLTMDVYNGAAYDGEMTNGGLRMKLTAVPYAFRAGQADSLTDGSSSITAANLLQKAPLAIQSVNAGIAGLRFNQVGTGGLIQIQADGSDIFTVSKTGNAYLGGLLNVDGASIDIGSSSLAGSLILSDGTANTGAISTAALSANRTYTLPDADGVICLTTTCAGAATTLQQAYGNDADGGDAVLGLTTADGSLILRNPATSGTGSAFAMRVEQLNTGAVAGLEIIQAGTGFAFRVNDDGTATDATPFVIDQNGNVGIGNTTASALLTVGSSEQFKVTSAGAVTAVGVTSSSGLTISSGGASITGGINNNSGGITNAGSITGLGTNLTAAAGLTIASGGTGDLILDSASNKLVLGATDGTIQRTAAGITTIDLIDGAATGLTLSNSGAGVANLNIADGALQIAGTTVITGTGVLQNVTASTDILTSGILGVARGGTGASSFTTNGILYGNSTGALQITSAGTGGQLLIANSTGVPGFVSLSGDAALSSTGALTINANSVSLSTDTTGDYVAALGTLVGLSVTGNSGEGSTPGLSVVYGSSNASAARGDTQLICPSGTGNLTGGGTTITLGTGGTCAALGISAAVSFATSVTSPLFTGTSAVTLSSGGSGALTITSGSGTISLGSGVLQYLGAGFSFDVSSAGTSTFNILNSNGSNVANLDVEGAISAGSNNSFTVNSDGDIIAAFTQLNGASTANGGALVASTSLTLTDAINFDVGNYVQVNSTDCGGTGVNICYAKITAKSTNTLTITPALTWTSGAAVNEFHVPELGGTDTAQNLASRYGRGYFIAGVATGNGTTYYNENSVTTSLTNFDFLNTGVTTLNIGGTASSLNLGASGGTVTIAGNVTVNGTISGSAPSSGTSGYFTRSGTTLSPANAGDSLSITGTLSGLTGLTINSGGASITGGINNNSGGITNAGSITGVGTDITATAGLTIASSGSGNLMLTSASGTLVLNSSIWQRSAAGTTTIDLADSGATTLALNNTLAGALSLNLVDGGLLVNSTSVLTNARALQNITGLSSSGTVTLSSLNAGGLVKSDTSGALSIAAGGADYELPLTFGSGLTRTSNATRLGGALTANTNIPLSGFNLTLSGDSGSFVLGAMTASGRFTLVDNSNSDSFFLNKTTATGNILSLQKSGSDVFTIFNSGMTQMTLPSSSSALVIRDGNKSFFTIDTSGNRVRIGSSASDDTGVIFVFGRRDAADDPAGETGAMYYNNTTDTFRCYEGIRGWADCAGGSRSNNRRTTRIDYPGSGTVFAGQGDISTTQGNAPSAVAATSTDSAALNYQGTVGGFTPVPINGISGNTNYNAGSNILFQTKVRLPTTAGVRIWAGMTDQTADTMAGSANPAGNYAAFRYDTSDSDTTWKCVTKNGTSQTVTNSGITVNTNAVKLDVVVASGQVQFKINGTIVCGNTTNLPASSAMLRYVAVQNALSATRDFHISWVYIESDR